jgi:hypothetical protein
MALNRRGFLKTAAVGALVSFPAKAQTNGIKRVVIVRDQPTAAIACLARVLAAHGVEVKETANRTPAPPADFAILARVQPGVPESFVVESPKAGLLSVTGGDARGLTYALLELADRAEHSGAGFEAWLDGWNASVISDRPANRVRAISRLFVSDVHDKPWFNDREMWPAYFEMLADNRFNRFHLAFGIGYDFLREVTDSYFVFAYPFFVSPPGYNVRAVNLPDAERDRNLEMLKYISEQAAAFHLDFQLGLWTHGYQWENSPHANYTIAGLTADNHAAYCRDALTMLLRACPAISGVTFRIHGESGVAEGNYPFWGTVFEGIVDCGRTVTIDLHSKGLDEQMLQTARATGMPVIVSPKFWAEHMGLPYHQADIRELEIPKGEAKGLMALSTGSRSFTRYGYADLLRSDRRYGVIHRIWSGSRRLMLWGDLDSAAAYSRAFQFCGSQGVDLMEPLSFKGRRGSGKGSRCGYADASLEPRWDWQKYLYTYRVWGRSMYNPFIAHDARRLLKTQFGASAEHVEAALANATRILPAITTAHAPSAANNNYWPEMYTNQPIVNPGKNQYSDTPSPKVFGNTSPLDPQLFSTVNGFAAELLSKQSTGKHSPVEVAQWLDDYAAAALNRLANVSSAGVDFRRLAVDVRIQAGIGKFFAAKLRAGVLYAIYEATADRAALDAALGQYRAARSSWIELAGVAKGVYVGDVTAGEQPWLRGCWQDRLVAIDEDIAAMAGKTAVAAEPGDAATERISRVLAKWPRVVNECRHTPPQFMIRGSDTPIEVSLERQPSQAVLYYRRVSQAERFECVEMKRQGDAYRADIPAAYTKDSAYPIQYYFRFHEGQEAWLFPTISETFVPQPYFILSATTLIVKEIM